MIKRVDSPGDGAAVPGEGRLARWSRLKQDARTEAERLPPVAEAEKTATSVPVRQPAPEADKADDPTKDLPPIESLTKDSDYSLFMREGVPDEMRAEALRKLWASDPAFREPFPFEMHMEDYRATFVPIDALKDTIYRVGRGFLTPEDLVAERKGIAADRAGAAGKDADPAADSESPLGASDFPEKKEGKFPDAPEAATNKSDKPA